MTETRLYSPDQAARYLGLGSRWAVYRLIANKQITAIRLAGKLRIDRDDLDRLIAFLKTDEAGMADRARQKAVLSTSPTLKPFGRRNSRTPVTMPVTGTAAAAQVLEKASRAAGASRASQCSSDARPALDRPVGWSA
jgi:excisionase family DNA binding protein